MGAFFNWTILIQECFVTRLMTVFSLYHIYWGKRSTFSFEQTNIFLNHLRMLYTYFGYKRPNGWDNLKSCQIIAFISYHINYFSLEKAVTFWFKQHLHALTQWCFVTSLVEIPGVPGAPWIREKHWIWVLNNLSILDIIEVLQHVLKHISGYWSR